MKTAKEMFEELGYKYISDEFGLIDCIKVENNNCYHIAYCYHIAFGVKDFWATENYRPMDIDMPTFKAIQKQLEELEWI